MPALQVLACAGRAARPGGRIHLPARVRAGQRRRPLPGYRRLALDAGHAVRLVIAIDGKTVRGAKDKKGKAPHLIAALAHGIGAVLGQVAVDEKSNEIPAVRELLKAFAGLAAR